MALLQQNQPALIDIVDADPGARRQRIGRRHRQQERVVEQCQRFDLGAFDRQRQHDGVEFAAAQFVEQQLGLRLAHLQPQLRIFRRELRQHARQDVGRQRRDDAEQEPPAQHVAVAGEVDQIARGGEDLLGALRRRRDRFR